MAWPPAGVDPSPPLGQQCEVALSASGTVPSLVPRAYVDSCQGCHGEKGAGTSVAPAVKKSYDYDEFVTLVRAGKMDKGWMPAFDKQHFDDDSLRRAYAYLTQSALTETGKCRAETAFTADQQQEMYQRGLAAWRSRNTAFDNAGCFQCHGPDGLTFAYVGFSDGDILRRANRHVEPAKAFDVVDMIHALRQKYSLPRRNPAVVRPLQPGGFVTAGATTAERDLSFGRQLQQMGLAFANGYINDSAQAALAAAELGNINMHALPVPIPFNHMAEDVVHNGLAQTVDCSADIDACADHGSLSDWMPIEPHVPSNANTWFATQDAYLANPNAANFYKLYGAVPAPQTMPGTYPIGYNYDVDHHKFQSQQILDFCVRSEVLGTPGCLENQPFAFDPNKGITSIWGEGEYANLFGTGLSTQPNCDIGQATCDPQQAPHFFSKLSKGAKLSDSYQRLRAPWFTMHWAHFDPTMLVTGDATIQQSEYFTRSLFWSNNDQDYAGKALRDAYSIFAVYQVTMQNIKKLQVSQANSCSKIPFTHPDLGVQTCTALDLRSGYFPQLCNFAEGKNWNNDSTYQLKFVPKQADRKELYQRLGGNMYRMFLRSIIGQLQKDNWICDAALLQHRIDRAKAFLGQTEIVAANGTQDQEMFATLAALLAKSATRCPPFDPNVPASY
jgi:hypothetical protein